MKIGIRLDGEMIFDEAWDPEGTPSISEIEATERLHGRHHDLSGPEARADIRQRLTAAECSVCDGCSRCVSTVPVVGATVNGRLCEACLA